MIVSVLALTAILTSCGKPSGRPGVQDDKLQKPKSSREKKLIIFHAGSLSVPFKKISERFMTENPEVTVLLEAAGSRICARKISDLKRSCDVMASADYTVIDKLLIPKFADWNIKFATNEMCIVYHKSSRRAKEINRENWYDILADKDVVFGHSDPNADPCGYRSILTMKLAGIYYKNPEITEKLLKKNNKCVRPKETDLLALLESGTIDYIFLYRSVAKQHGLDILLLPDEINLKTPKYADFYKKATVEITGKKPGELTTKTGAPMVYGVTIPKNAPNPDIAFKFLEYLLAKDKGMKIMEELGQPSAVPSPSATYDKIPEVLKIFAVK